MRPTTQKQPHSTSDRGWNVGPRRPVLGNGALHVWRADLARVSDDVLYALSPDEYVRAERFLDRSKSRLWARSRGVLRELLSRYLERPPRHFRFVAGKHGKPEVLERKSGSTVSVGQRRNAHAVFFNISHSGELAMYAFTDIGPVGVDVEVGRHEIDEAALAARLGIAAAYRLAELDRTTRHREFLRSWVRLEADVKQRGSQLGTSTHGGVRTSWLTELDVGLDAAAAVVVERRPTELRCWTRPAS